MRPRSLWLCVLALAARSLAAAEITPAHGTNPVYRERAEKIVAKLDLTDEGKIARVRDAIAAHYSGVNVIDDAVDARIQALRQQPAADRAATEAASKTLREEAQPKLAKLHADFIAKLSADLSPAQIDEVKDGLTYGILPLTFRVYQEMLPTLTAEQKAQILAWLTEAREHAIDAGSSGEKHAWFGKYKGRIGNYLAKAGYDMKAAEKNLTKKP